MNPVKINKRDWSPAVLSRNPSAVVRPLQIEDIKQALNLKHTEKEDEEKRIANTRTIIEDLKTELASVGEQPDLLPRIESVNVELRRCQEERARLEGEKSDIRREKDNLTAESRSVSLLFNIPATTYLFSSFSKKKKSLNQSSSTISPTLLYSSSPCPAYPLHPKPHVYTPPVLSFEGYPSTC